MSSLPPSGDQVRAGGKSGKAHIQAIDGLRALAVVSVIVFHLFPHALPGGYAGVDIFFVISGYVVTMSLYRQPVDSFLSFISAFYVRRIARIYPALVTCLCIVGVLSALFVPRSFLATSSAWTGLFAFGGLGNIALIRFNDGYFSPTFEFNPYGHTWSLGVEEQFYLLYPILVFLWLRRKKQDSLFSWQSATIAALCLASLAWSAWQTHANRESAYYLLPSRFWELGVGALLYLSHARKSLIPKSASSAAVTSFVGFAFMLICLVFADKNLFPFPWAIAAVAGSAMFMSAALANAGPLVRLFASRPFTYVGRLSYSLYLWHFPAIVLLRWTVGLGSIWCTLAASVLGILAAMASYHFVEPFGRGIISKRPGTTRRCLMVGVASILAGVACWGLVYVVRGKLSLSHTADGYTWYPKTIKEGTLLKGPEGRPFSNRRIFVIGDSHAQAYSEMLKMASDETGASLEILSKAGCSIATLLKPTEPVGGCLEFRDNSVEKVLAEGQPGDLVFLASLRVNRLGDQWATNDIAQVVQDQVTEAAADNRAKALADADKLISRFEQKGLLVLIDAPMPTFPSPPFRCADWFDKMNPVCDAGFQVTRPFMLDFRKPVMASIESLRPKHHSLFIWDAFSYLCPGDICSAFSDGKPLFFDCDHLSGFGNRMLEPHFVTELKKIWPAG